ncbi:MAG: hypothetical protein WA906_12580 [Pacificimonas sp.]
MTRFFSALFAMTLLSSPTAAQVAAEVPDDPRDWFETRTAEAAPHAPTLSDLRDEALLRARWSVTTLPCATEPTTIRLYGLQPATADRMVSEGLLDGAFTGGWTFYGETDCAETPVIRYLYVREPSGGHIMLVVNRGESLATPSMMRITSAEVGADVYAFAVARQPGCEIETVRMRNVRVLETDGNLGPQIAGTRFTGGWSEIWSFEACDQNVEAIVRFDADGKGGTTARTTQTRIASGVPS